MCTRFLQFNIIFVRPELAWKYTTEYICIHVEQPNRCPLLTVHIRKFIFFVQKPIEMKIQHFSNYYKGNDVSRVLPIGDISKKTKMDNKQQVTSILLINVVFTADQP